MFRENHLAPRAAERNNTLTSRNLARKTRILIVDDELGFTRMLTILLEKTGRYEVKAENDETETLETAAQFKPDLILLDLVMPKMDGGSLARAMSVDPRLDQTPILFLSASVSKREGNRAQIAGFPAIPKPIRLEELVRAIESNLPPAMSP